jgi:hypothetical protein
MDETEGAFLWRDLDGVAAPMFHWPHFSRARMAEVSPKALRE